MTRNGDVIVERTEAGQEGRPTGIGIRPATEADQARIKSMIRAEAVNPHNLHWPRFLVAEDQGGRVVGIRQVKIHKRGTREVASGVVLPEFRRQGISAELMHALLAREPGTLYLQCSEKRAPYYERFGFSRVKPSELPPDLRRQHRMARIVVAVRSLLVRRRLRIVPMKRDGHRRPGEGVPTRPCPAAKPEDRHGAGRKET